MKYLSLLTVLFFLGCQSQSTEFQSDNQPLTPVPFDEVILEDRFWKPRLQTQLETLVPFALDKTIPAVENLKKTANFRQGIQDDLPFPHRYISSDLYKVMEGAAYLLMEKRDSALEARMDHIIDIIAAAQQEDGYLYVSHITGVAKDHAHWGGGGMGDRPYSWVVHSHELYNIGHMIEAAIAYYRATGKDKWLKVAEKSARHINRVFFEGDPNYNNGKPVNQATGHQELELALAKLFRLTGDSLYLNMARKFLDIRGVTYVPEGEQYLAPTYAQQHRPVAEQEKAVGHAVRAAYMYSAMAEVDGLTRDSVYRPALEKIWHNIVDTKMHITGGLGAVHGVEGFGPEYFLPNKEAYNETCAAVGNVFYNFRMFLASKKAKYMDVAEVALYNNVLAGVNLEGNDFFYVNPLEADGETAFNHGEAGRSPWFNTACCPSNLARLIPQVTGLMYAHTGREVWVSLYASSQAKVPLEKGEVQLIQETNYPFEGKITVTVNPNIKKQQFTLKMRIPTWAQNEQFVPGELYHYAYPKGKKWTIRLNGREVQATLMEGFATITRQWQKGDQVILELPMPIRFNTCLEQVEANRGRLAVTRGPLVYCAEAVDNPKALEELRISATSSYRIDQIETGKLKGISSILIGEEANLITMIPYYAWNNRGDDWMMVWLVSSET